MSAEKQKELDTKVSEDFNHARLTEVFFFTFCRCGQSQRFFRPIQKNTYLYHPLLISLPHRRVCSGLRQVLVYSYVFHSSDYPKVFFRHLSSDACAKDLKSLHEFFHHLNTHFIPKRPASILQIQKELF